MSIKDKILAIITGIASLLSAIFYVLMKQSKEEQKAARAEAQELKTEIDDLNNKAEIKKEMADVKKEIEQETEDKVNDIIDGSMSAPDVLSELAKNSKSRIH